LHLESIKLTMSIAACGVAQV